MTDSGDDKRDFDPRYDPRFQPGYVPTDDGEPDDVRSLSSSKGEEPAVKLPSIPTGTAARFSESFGTGGVGPSSGSDRARRRFPWFHVALGAFALAQLVGGGILIANILIWHLQEPSVARFSLLRLVWQLGPTVFVPGILAVVALLLLAGMRSRFRRALAQPAGEPEREWHAPSGIRALWVLGIVLCGASVYVYVRAIEMSNVDASGGESAYETVVTMSDTLAPGLLTSGLMALILACAASASGWRRARPGVNPFVCGLWIGSAVCAIGGVIVSGMQPEPPQATSGQSISGGILFVFQWAARTTVGLALSTIVGLLTFHAWTWPRRESDLSGRVRPLEHPLEHG